MSSETRKILLQATQHQCQRDRFSKTCAWQAHLTYEILIRNATPFRGRGGENKCDEVRDHRAVDVEDQRQVGDLMRVLLTSRDLLNLQSRIVWGHASTFSTAVRP